MVIIVPAAGLSTRFPHSKPKYLLRDDTGALMLEKAIDLYLRYRIVVGVLQRHIDDFGALAALQDEFGDQLNYVVIPELTRGPAETVYQILKADAVNGAFLIKDCDSYFDHLILDGNYVCTTRIADHDVLIKLSAKSFVIANDQRIITDIVEKRVVSDKFCVGGYKFESAIEYCAAFEQITERKVQQELFVSHVIQQMLLNGSIFVDNQVVGYHDVGTAHGWKLYNAALAA